MASMQGNIPFFDEPENKEEKPFCTIIEVTLNTLSKKLTDEIYQKILPLQYRNNNSLDDINEYSVDFIALLTVMDVDKLINIAHLNPALLRSLLCNAAGVVAAVECKCISIEELIKIGECNEDNIFHATENANIFIQLVNSQKNLDFKQFVELRRFCPDTFYQLSTQSATIASVLKTFPTISEQFKWLAVAGIYNISGPNNNISILGELFRIEEEIDCKNTTRLQKIFTDNQYQDIKLAILSGNKTASDCIISCMNDVGLDAQKIISESHNDTLIMVYNKMYPAQSITLVSSEEKQGQKEDKGQKPLRIYATSHGIEIEVSAPERVKRMMPQILKYIAPGWRNVDDSTIVPKNSKEAGMELVSPILRTEEDIATIKTVTEAAKTLGCSVNSSCGVHNHLGVDHFPQEKLPDIMKQFIINMIYTEKFVGLKNGLFLPRNMAMRSYLGEVKPDTQTEEEFVGNIINAKTFAELLRISQPDELTPEGRCRVPLRACSGNGRKNAIVNIVAFDAHGTMEVRSPHPTLEYDDIIAVIEFTDGMMYLARDMAGVSLEEKDTESKIHIPNDGEKAEINGLIHNLQQESRDVIGSVVKSEISSVRKKHASYTMSNTTYQDFIATQKPSRTNTCTESPTLRGI